MKKTLIISGRIHEMSRTTGTLMVTICTSSGTYVDIAVGDLPIAQEEIQINTGKILTVKVEAEIDQSVCSEKGHVDDPFQEREVHCLRCSEHLGMRDLRSGQIILNSPDVKLVKE